MRRGALSPQSVGRVRTKLKFWTDEKLSTLVALIAVFVSLTAAYLAFSATQNSTRAQYVGLAVSILREASKSQSDAALRGWATDVLSKYSKDVPLPPSVIADLKSGKITLTGAALIGEAHDTTRGEGGHLN
jgi:hypothetical protein